jgi:hypothetical protein
MRRLQNPGWRVGGKGRFQETETISAAWVNPRLTEGIEF